LEIGLQVPSRKSTISYKFPYHRANQGIQLCS
jgi:hypothetical protein